MVILGKKFGRLANRLWIFSYFAANAMEYGYKLLYRNFDEYIRYFPACHRNDFSGYRIQSRISRFLPLDYFVYWSFQLFIEIINRLNIQFGRIKIKRMKAGNIYDLNQKEYLDSANHDILFIRDGGFHYQDQQNLMKHAETIRQFFMPAKKYQLNISALFREKRLTGKALVGVHIRKYDYKWFMGGLMFFSNMEYLNNMRLIEQELQKKSRDVQFLICSDEPLNPQLFAGMDYFFGTGHLIEDLYAFSQCDYLIGPPSTYTSWASFYGNVPLSFISPETRTIDVNGFKVIDNINTFYDYIKYCEKTLDLNNAK